MTIYLSSHPRVLSLLHTAKQSPEDDGVRLVLADYLEDHGDPDRAEFIRLQCQPLNHRPEWKKRQEELLSLHGGAWLGPLWDRPLFPVEWHRGLLSCGFPPKFRHQDVGSTLPWIDTAVLAVTGSRALELAVAFLSAAELNHAGLDLRRTISPDRVLDALRAVPQLPLLRTLTIRCPVGMLQRQDDIVSPALSAPFIESLLGLPLAKCLTHLGSWPALSAEQTAVVRGRGVEVASGLGLWMHGLNPS
jgi:uncharacterized protein (TIGR02996 family)